MVANLTWFGFMELLVKRFTVVLPKLCEGMNHRPRFRKIVITSPAFAGLRRRIDRTVGMRDGENSRRGGCDNRRHRCHRRLTAVRHDDFGLDVCPAISHGTCTVTSSDSAENTGAARGSHLFIVLFCWCASVS